MCSLNTTSCPFSYWYESDDQFPKLHSSAKLSKLSGSTPRTVFAARGCDPGIKHAIQISNRSLLLAIGCCLILDLLRNGVDPAPVFALMHMLRDGF